MTRLGSLAARLSRAQTRISARLLLFNVLLVFLPVGGLIYLDAYEQHLLEQQERAMVDAGRILAAALTETPLEPVTVTALTMRLAGATDSRLRVIGPNRVVVADTHAGREGDSDARADADPGGDPVRSSWLYRVGAASAAVLRGLVDTPTATPDSEVIVGPGNLITATEVERALGGRYGSTTRLSPGGQRSVTLYSALPITRSGSVTGAVLVSQSTWRLLQRLYDVRLRMFTVVVLSLGFAVALMAVASFSIVRPLRRLRDDAESLVDRRGRLVGRFRGVKRRDEIGELARALEALTSRLEAHLRFTEQFSADVTHEFRNPLASIRASAETLAAAERSEDRVRFQQRIERDITRLEALLTGVRDLTFVDTMLEEEARGAVDLRLAVRESTSEREHPFTLQLPDEPLIVDASSERIRQILGNLIDNAVSFSPAGVAIEVATRREGHRAHVRVRDRGPGIAEAHMDRVFDRFFCHRPGQAEARQHHTGLGLSIAQTIAQSYGGRVVVTNHADGGAVFELILPLRA